MWFSKSADAVLKELSVDQANGLSDEEASTRLEKYGVNKLLAEKKKSILLMFIAQLKNWLIYILLGAVVITIFMGEYVDAAIILLVININAFLGIIQEVKAGKAPLIATQLLWINLITDSLPAIALGMDPGNPFSRSGSFLINTLWEQFWPDWPFSLL